VGAGGVERRGRDLGGPGHANGAELADCGGVKVVPGDGETGVSDGPAPGDGTRRGRLRKRGGAAAVDGASYLTRTVHEYVIGVVLVYVLGSSLIAVLLVVINACLNGVNKLGFYHPPTLAMSSIVLYASVGGLVPAVVAGAWMRPKRVRIGNGVGADGNTRRPLVWTGVVDAPGGGDVGSGHPVEAVTE